ncbi:MAG: hypothetical protein Q9216_001482 [Gyalolechia sp. 2 TL-2023]
MSETQAPVTTTAAEPVTATAQGANTDPIRTNATNDLIAESRPEVTESAAAPATETTAADGITEAPKGAAVVESQPINEGVLSYKQPGLVKSLMYSKKFFWFGEEPVEHKHLTDYLRGEKTTDVARPNAAHATQTGKGLLFFAKRAEDKPQPQGIINLADIKDVAKAGPTEFSFKYHNHKHAFQAMTATERDGWVDALDTRHTEAKTEREGIVGSEGYKSSMEKFAKPGAMGAGGSTSRSLSRHKKANDTKAADTSSPVAAKVGGGDSASSSDEAKVNNAKSRSQSRKRSSMFGAFLSKKEQHDEKKELKKEEKDEKKEEKAEEKAIKAEIKHEEKEERKEEKPIVKEEKKALKNDGVVDPAPLDAAAIASRVLANPVVPAEGTNVEEPATAATETTATTATANNPAISDTPATTTARDPNSKANKRNSIFGSFFSKKEPSTSTSPATNTTTQESAPAVPTKDTEPAAVSSTAPPTEIVAKEPAPTVDTSVPATTTETVPTSTSSTTPVSPETAKANRRSSFFSNLGTKKEKRTGGVSDAEGTDGEGKKSGGFGGLLRKASRAQGHKPAPKPMPATDGVADKEPPAPINKDAPATEPTTNGEVVPESTTTTSQTPVQAAA